MERRPASASMQPPAAARGRMRPESAGRSRPQSAGVTADRLPLPPRMEAPAERVEYNGSSQRVEYTGSSMAGAADVLRQSRGRPMSARSNRESVCSELSSANSVASLPRASKGLREARDEVTAIRTWNRPVCRSADPVLDPCSGRLSGSTPSSGGPATRTRARAR